MNDKQLIAFIKYCDLAFGQMIVNVKDCFDRLNADASAKGMTRSQYLDYVFDNDRLPD